MQPPPAPPNLTLKHGITGKSNERNSAKKTLKPDLAAVKVFSLLSPCNMAKSHLAALKSQPSLQKYKMSRSSCFKWRPAEQGEGGPEDATAECKLAHGCIWGRSQHINLCFARPPTTLPPLKKKRYRQQHAAARGIQLNPHPLQYLDKNFFHEKSSLQPPHEVYFHLC